MSEIFPVIILAGGLATRLRPMTNTLPKSLVPINGQPFIAHQLKHLAEHGVTHVTLCLGYLGEMIEAFVGDGSRWNLEITYSYDGGCPLGTGGALINSIHLVGENFYVLYGDSYLPINFNNIQKKYNCSSKTAMMLIIKNKNKWDQSNVIYENGRLIKYDKSNPSLEMAYIDYGLAILNKGIFSNYPRGSNFDLARIYNDLSKEGRLEGCEVFERFYEIGSKAGIEELETYLKQRDL